MEEYESKLERVLSVLPFINGNFNFLLCWEKGVKGSDKIIVTTSVI